MWILRRLWTFWRRGGVDAEIRREMAFHLEMEAAERERRGLEPAQAARAARVGFGGVESVREEIRDARGLTFLDHLVQDVRFGVRLLARQPGFTAVAVLILALGIGANTAVFSLVNAMLLKPRPGHAAGEILGLHHKDTSRAEVYRSFSYPDIEDLRARTDVFAAVTAHSFAIGGLRTADTTRRVFIDIVTASYFDLFGAAPAIGRAFTREEERPGTNIPVTVLSYSAWQRMGGPADIVGRSVRLNDRDFQVVGVARKGFGGSIAFATPELWVPTGVYDTITNDFARDGLTTSLADRRHYNLIAMVRLRPGATAASVETALAGISARMQAAFPVENKDHALLLAPLSRMTVSPSPADDTATTGVFIAFLSMAVIVLIVASANLANMLLARAGARRKEFAVRLAIGGSKARLVRQLLTEGFVLAVAGGAAGLVLSIWATRLLFAMLTPISPIAFSFDPVPDWRIFAATLGYSALATLCFGLLPARSLARTDAAPALKDHAGELRSGRRRLALPNLLVTGQLALSLVLMTVAAMFMRGAATAAEADPGFSLERGVLAQIDPGLAGADATRSRAIQRAALDRLRARPDVEAASLATIIPFGDVSNGIRVQLPGPELQRGKPGDAGLMESTVTGISAGYFDALDRRILAGRDFTPAEELRPDGPRIAIVDEPLARALFGTEHPVGRQFQYTPRGEGQTPVLVEIVGLAPGFRDSLFDLAPTPHVYFPLGREFQTGVHVHARTRAESADAEAALLPSFRRDLMSVEATLPVLSLETLPGFRDRNLLLAVVRMGAAIFTVFGGVALFLAAVGLYGVKAYVVSCRTREIGIRVALGATPRRVVWMVVRDGLVASAIGLATGVLLSALAGAALKNFSYQNRAADAVVLGLAVAVLVAAGIAASWLPARRATRISPTKALRA